MKKTFKPVKAWAVVHPIIGIPLDRLFAKKKYAMETDAYLRGHKIIPILISPLPPKKKSPKRNPSERI